MDIKKTVQEDPDIGETKLLVMRYIIFFMNRGLSPLVITLAVITVFLGLLLGYVYLQYTDLKDSAGFYSPHEKFPYQH